MLLSDRKQLEDAIVTALGARPQLSAKELHRAVQSTRTYSIQGLYKELHKLESSGVIVKEGLQYSLRLPWTLKLADFAETATAQYVQHAGEVLTLPKKGKKRIWHFRDVQQLNNFWSQVLLFLIQHVPDNTLYSWMPHPWYHLVYTEQEQQYTDAVRRMDVRLYIINRGQTYLDRWVEQFWKQPHIEYSFHAKPLNSVAQNTYLNVIGDYVLTVKLGSGITQSIELLYRKTRNSEAVDFRAVFRVFNQKVKATMWLERNEKKSHRIKSVFRRHFGIVS